MMKLNETENFVEVDFSCGQNQLALPLSLPLNTRILTRFPFSIASQGCTVSKVIFYFRIDSLSADWLDRENLGLTEEILLIFLVTTTAKICTLRSSSRLYSQPSQPRSRLPTQQAIQLGLPVWSQKSTKSRPFSPHFHSAGPLLHVD